jgi:hypothetical protein
VVSPILLEWFEVGAVLDAVSSPVSQPSIPYMSFVPGESFQSFSMQPGFAHATMFKWYEHSNCQHIGIALRGLIWPVDVCADPSIMILDEVSIVFSPVSLQGASTLHEILLHIM